MTHHPRRGAFTLIELLVVIAIISLLVSILLPSLTQAKALVRAAVCLSNQRSLAIATSFYAMDYQGQTPVRGRLVSGGHVPAWPYDLWTYAGAGDTPPAIKSYNPQDNWWDTIFNCPVHPLPSGIGESWDLGTIYSFNTWLKSSVDNDSIYQRVNLSARLESIVRSDTFLYVEQASKLAGEYLCSHYTVNPLNHVYHGTALTGAHTENTNAVFVDSHAQYMAPDDWPRNSDGSYVTERYHPRWNGKN